MATRKAASVPKAPATEADYVAELTKKLRGGGGRRVVIAPDPTDGSGEEEPHRLIKSLSAITGGVERPMRVAFDKNPLYEQRTGGAYAIKSRYLPDTLLKRLAVYNPLVACCVLARANQARAHGVEQPDKHSYGCAIEPKKQFARLPEKRRQAVQKRAHQALRWLLTCGHQTMWPKSKRMHLSQFLYLGTRGALVHGRLPVEIINVRCGDGKIRAHSFRPADPSTIFPATPVGSPNSGARQARVTGVQRRFEQERREDPDDKPFAPPVTSEEQPLNWIQVIDGQKVTAFTDDEMFVENFYPTLDVELEGFPLTPLDTVANSVFCHLAVGTHNRNYFQAGRASRGMLIIQSDDANPALVQQIRQQFNASVNGVEKAFRFPVFAVGQEDKLNYQPLEGGQRDAEFTYLYDMLCREILTAFMISPEELPGWAYLSRGTNNQSLSESNNEYMLEAHRDLGIRPLIAQWETLLNDRLLPLYSRTVARYFRVRLLGLDAETPEKQSVRAQQDAPLWGTMNWLLEKADKLPLAKEMAADVPFNASWQQLLDKYVPVGVQLERLCGVAGASQDPQYAYLRDPYWFQNQQIIKDREAAAAQQQQGGQPGVGGGGQSSAGGGGGPQQGGQPPQGSGGGQQPPSSPPQGDRQQGQGDAGGGLQDRIEGAQQAMGKREPALPPAAAAARKRGDELVTKLMADYRQDSDRLIRQLAQGHRDLVGGRDKTK